MKKTLEEVKADIVSLREHVAKYRSLSEQRRDAGDVRISEKLLEFVHELESKVREMEAMLTERPD